MGQQSWFQEQLKLQLAELSVHEYSTRIFCIKIEASFSKLSGIIFLGSSNFITLLATVL